MSDWEAVIGLEVHAQLSTRTKLFCRCPTDGAAEPNQAVCPVCLGLPGALPLPNGEAVRLAVRAALALGCQVAGRSGWSRKSYFYPDLPKGYQITQEDEPLARSGSVRIETPAGEPRWIGLRRLHLEEDAGKSLHGAGPGGETGIDFDRCGHPLIEIVTEPELTDPEHARRCVERLRALLAACGVCRGELETGALRCDANVSVRRPGAPPGERVEVKNLNSLRSIRRALRHEVARQRSELEAGRPVVRETRAWDERAGRTLTTRSKEDEPDYRYFPEPDLPPLRVDEALRESAGRDLPELPHQTLDRLVREHGLRQEQAYRLTLDSALADYYERVARVAGDAPAAAEWILTELTGRARDARAEPDDGLVPASELGELVRRTGSGQLTRAAAKRVLDDLVAGGGSVDEVVGELGLDRRMDEEELEQLCRRVLADHPGQVQQYRAGKRAVIGFFIGRVMEASGSRGDPKRARGVLQRLLEG